MTQKHSIAYHEILTLEINVHDLHAHTMKHSINETLYINKV